MQSGNDFGSWISMDARNLAGRSFPFFCCPNAGSGFEDKKHFRKAGRKYEQKKWKSRQELAETGGRIPVQGYLCTESQ